MYKMPYAPAQRALGLSCGNRQMLLRFPVVLHVVGPEERTIKGRPGRSDDPNKPRYPLVSPLVRPGNVSGLRKNRKIFVDRLLRGKDL